MNDFERLTVADFSGLVAGETSSLKILGSPVRLSLPTPFSYQARSPVVVFAVSDGSRVRLSEGGQLLKYLETQGMDLSTDLILSKTVFHALQETPGIRMGNGQVYMETTLEQVSLDLARFVQALLEVTGLRHAKYKEALVQLARANDGLGTGAMPPSAPLLP